MRHLLERAADVDRALGFDIDYKRLLREFQSRGDLLRAFYYTARSKIRNFPRFGAAHELLAASPPIAAGSLGKIEFTIASAP